MKHHVGNIPSVSSLTEPNEPRRTLLEREWVVDEASDEGDESLE